MVGCEGGSLQSRLDRLLASSRPDVLEDYWWVGAGQGRKQEGFGGTGLLAMPCFAGSVAQRQAGCVGALLVGRGRAGACNALRSCTPLSHPPEPFYPSPLPSLSLLLQALSGAADGSGANNALTAFIPLPVHLCPRPFAAPCCFRSCLVQLVAVGRISDALRLMDSHDVMQGHVAISHPSMLPQV